MKSPCRIFALFLCLGLFLTGCAQEPSPETTPTVTIPPLAEALALYSNAREAIQNATDLQVATALSRTRTVRGQTYSEQITAHASYHQETDGSLQALVSQELRYGTFQTQYQEFFTDGCAYISANGAAFQSTVTADQFISRQTPASLIDPALYSEAQVLLENGLPVIQFTAPTALEHWATDFPDAQLVSASGTVTLGTDGTLSRSTYEAAYQCGDTAYTLSVTSAPTVGPDSNLTIPAIPEACVMLEYMDAPKRILQVVGDVYTSQAISASQTSYLYSEFAPLVRTQTSQLDIIGAGNGLQAKTQYDVTVVDYSNTPQHTVETQCYSGGTLSTVVNGGEPRSTSQSADKIRMTYEDTFLSPVLTLDLLAGANAVTEENLLKIQFNANDAFGQNLCDGIYATFLKIDLDQYYSFTNNTLMGYLYIDLTTGLPTAMGYHMSRTHQCGNVPHVLQYKLDQTISLSSPTALDTVTGSQG